MREWTKTGVWSQTLQMVIATAGVMMFAIYIVSSAAAASPASPQQESYYSAKVQPILKANCYKCHGFIHRGGLRLTSPEDILRGGNKGPVVVPGHPEDSLLIEYVTSQARHRHMPPKKNLSPEDIAVLKQWIRDGAKK
ncbi:MAG: c-type cytochrome domain-containing protein [Acidobacteriaceae bacterium]